MEVKKIRKMNISFLIALCNIIDKFDHFNSELELFILKFNVDIDTLKKVFSGKFVFGNQECKSFYKEHKEVIDLFNEYADIIEFIKLYYLPFKTSYFELQKESMDDYENLIIFTEYLLNHKNQIENILKLLHKLQCLGFDEVILEEKDKFNKEIHQISTTFASNKDMVYLENLKCIPNHDEELVNYRSDASNYKITLNLSLDKRISLRHNTVDSFEQSIVVNNLVFDANLLPDEINPELMFEEIIATKSDNLAECETITNAVTLGVEFYDLGERIEEVYAYVESLGKFKNKGSIKKILLKMQEQLLKLKFEQDKYFLEIASGLPDVSEEYIHDELTLCLKRREEESKLDSE